MSWPPAFAEADEVRLASYREDGTLRKPVIVWVVRVADDLYVRSYRGRGSDWFRHALKLPRGRVWGGSAAHDIRFVEGDDGRSAEIDAAFRAKYGRYGGGYVDSITSATSREATVKLSPDTPSE